MSYQIYRSKSRTGPWEACRESDVLAERIPIRRDPQWTFAAPPNGKEVSFSLGGANKYLYIWCRDPFSHLFEGVA